MQLWRECQLLTQIHHPNLVRISTFYSALVSPNDFFVEAE